MTHPDEHRRVRELLGALATGHLPVEEAVAVQAHVDGCASCQLELRELRLTADSLRAVDLAHLGPAEDPPAALGTSILTAVRREQALAVRRRRRGQATRAVAAVAAAAALVVAGAVLGDERRPTATVATKVPMEQVALTSRVPGVTVQKSILIPHSWGIELQMAAIGLTDGERYRGRAIGADGRIQPAGEFLGVAGKSVKCNLQAALLRRDTRTFEIVDAAGEVVMIAQLT